MLGEKVKSIRKGLEINQAVLAKAACIDRTVISRIESGRVKELKTHAFSRLANALGVKMEELVESNGKEFEVSILRVAHNSLSKERVKQLEDFARFLLREEEKI